MNKVPRERKSLGAIKIPGIVQRRNSLSKEKSPATISRTNSIKKDVKPVPHERKRQSLSSTLPAKRLDNNNLSNVLDKNTKKELSSVAATANSRKEDKSMKDPKRKLSILSQTSPSLGEALKRSNSASKPASGPQSRLNVRRKSSDNILDTKSSVDSSQRPRAPYVSSLTRGKPVTAARGKTQSPGLVKKDFAKSEFRTTVNLQANGSNDRSKSSHPTLIKSKLTPGAFRSKDIKLSVLSPGSKREKTSRQQIVLTPISKPLQRSKSVVLAEDKKLKETKQSPRIPCLDTGLSGSKKMIPDPHSDSGQKSLSLEKEYSINDLSTRIKGDKDKETILGLKRTLEDNLKKFNVMVLCFQNVISKNEELEIRLANKNEELESLKGSLANLQVSLHILKRTCK